MALSAPTPETETSTHYFFGFVRNFGIHDAELHKMIETNFTNVFKEDVAVLNAQQQRMTQMPNAPEIDIKVDGPPKLARLVVSRLKAAEAQARLPVQTAAE
jgi:hypothetical protein